MRYHRNRPRLTLSAKGFTLVEIMVVVVIIGLLAAMSIPAFSRVREASQHAKLINDIRVIEGALQTYNFETGDWPEDAMHGVAPPELVEFGYLVNVDWSQPTPVGGLFDWDRDVFGISAAISLYQPQHSTEGFQRFATRHDNGSINDGRFRLHGNRYMWVIEEE